jgi:PAS domain S-box-containing protein
MSIAPQCLDRPDVPPTPQAALRDATWDVLSDHIKDVIILADPSGAIFYASPSCQYLGYAQRDLIGGKAAAFVHPEDLDRFMANSAALLTDNDGAAPRDREHRIRCKDGSWRWMEGNPSLLPSGDGGVVGTINVFRDISKQHEVRERLIESERRYRLIAQNTTDMISQTRCADGRLTYLSPSVERITGYQPDELLGQRMQDHVHPDDRAAFMAAFVDLVSGAASGGRAIQFRARHRDGSWLWLESNPKLVRGADGAPTDIIDVTREVGEQQRLKADLSEALAEARKHAAVKDEFLANMSHEIRTPLTSVLGFTSLLAERQDLDATARGHLARIAGAGRALLAIVNDVLDVSKLDAGEMTLAPTPTDAVAAVRDVVEMFELEAEAKGLTLTCFAAPGAPDWVQLDPNRFRQILINLVGNAMKFTDQGAVAVSLAYDRERQEVAVEVADTGPGISASGREKLFQRFSQVDSSSTRAKGGAGLGLAICQSLAKAMGGSISLRSRVGQGSTFRVELPAVEAEAGAPQTDDLDASSLEGVRVLVVDDNAANRELARTILGPVGVEVTEARDGAEAIELAGRLPVDLILMDLRMPGVDGYAATAAIRRDAGPNRDTPILAFSSDAPKADETGRMALFDGQIQKPLTPLSLLMTVRKAVFDPLPEMEDQRHVAC